MINLLRAECYKLRKSVPFYLSLLVTTVCSVVLAILTHGIANGDYEIAFNSLAGLSDVFIMSVIGSLMAGILICSDFDNKNIHDAISSGRLAIVTSKSVMFVLVISLLVMPYAVVSFVGFVTQGEFSASLPFSTYLLLMSNVNQTPVDGSSIGKAIEILLISLILYAAKFSICIPVAFKVRKAVGVTVIGVLLGFFSEILINMLGKIPILKECKDYIPYSYQVLSLDMGQKDLIKILLVCLVFIVLMITLTYWIFRKTEIK